MQTAKNGDTVTIEFTVRTDDGRVVGNTGENGPQKIVLGTQEVFPQIDAALTGMEVGAEETVKIPSDNAYGPRRDELIVDVPLQNLPTEPAPQPGMMLSAQQQDGNPIQLIITKVGENSVTADGNHPLAGEDLTFNIKLVAIAGSN